LNASPIIVLARVGQEHLFDALADEVVVPQAVVEEIQAGPTGDPARQAVGSGRFAIVDTTPVSEVLAWDLGTGETAVLSCALAESGWTVIVDDAAARKCAQSFGLPIKGTLAVVILAKQHGLIPSAADVLRSLLKGGFRLDETIIREVLSRAVDEEWE
jgi:predicted nucleic acid-binding protein